MAVNQDGQHPAQGFGGHITCADDPKKTFALSHIKYDSRHAPKFKISKQINSPKTHHDGYCRRNRMPKINQYQDNCRQSNHHPKHPNHQTIQQKMVLKIAVNLADYHHPHR